MCSGPNPFDDATNEKLDERQKLICDLLSEKVTSCPEHVLLQEWAERLDGPCVFHHLVTYIQLTGVLPRDTETIKHRIWERHKPNGNKLHSVAYYDVSGEKHVAWVYSAIQDQNGINRLVNKVFQQVPKVLFDSGIRGATISEHKSQTLKHHLVRVETYMRG